jgi:hypothetical protein
VRAGMSILYSSGCCSWLVADMRASSRPRARKMRSPSGSPLGSFRRWTARICLLLGDGRDMARWPAGETTVQFLVDRERLESFEADDLAELAQALIGRAELRVETTATAALAGGDIDGAFVAAYDAYRMAAEALLARQGLRATGDRGSHTAVEDAVSAQFKEEIPAFVKPTFARLRETRHSAQYYDPSSPPITAADASWAIGKARDALSGVKALLAAEAPPERFA